MPRRAAVAVDDDLPARHARVGVEASALPGEETVRVGNRTFVLCEVAGPAKLRPGAKSVSGSFEYVLIEPA